MKARTDGQRRIDASSDMLDAFVVARGGPTLRDEQKAHRFGQRDDENGQEQQRRGAADGENAAPSHLREQLRADETAECGADREAAEHQRDEAGAPLARTILGRQCDRIGHRTPEPEARDEAQSDEPREIRRKTRYEARGTEHADRSDEHRLASETIRKRAEDKRARHQTEESCAEERSERCGSEMPLLAQGRPDKADGRGIEAIDGYDQEAQQQDAFLKGREGARIDELIDAQGDG
ncbi:protein of unknown function [Caballeronia sp. S22]